ncbi:hypothetical protein Acsp03_33900 [Actinomadura sp. NBRC 104412]|nr:hypothetical protein Acsp03_33900 [Actinomadura sp. NBRC 104412]
MPSATNASDAWAGCSAPAERNNPNKPHMHSSTPITGVRFARPGTGAGWRASRTGLVSAGRRGRRRTWIKLGAVNRAPRWLLPTVLTALILCVVAGAVFG